MTLLEGEIMKKKRKYAWIAGITAAILCVVVIIAGILALFSINLENTLKIELENNLETMTQQSFGNIFKQLANVKEITKHIADVMGNTWGAYPIEAQLEYLKQITSVNGFKRVSVVTQQLYVVTSDGNTLILEERDIIKSMMDRVFKGETIIGDILPSKVDGRLTLSIGAPIVSENKVVGVLVASLGIDFFVEMMASSNVYSDVNNLLVSKDGSVLVAPDLFQMGDISELEFTEKTYDELMQSMQNGESGKTQLIRNGQKYYGTYIPLKMNDWYAFSFIPEESVTVLSNEIMHNTFLLLIGTLALLAILTILVFMLMRAKNRELASTNAKFEIVANNIPGGIMGLVDKNGEMEIDYISNGMMELFCKTEEEIKKAWSENPKDLIYYEDRDRVMTELPRQVFSGNGTDVEFRSDCGGDIKFLHLRAQSSDNGKRVFILVTDITEFKRANEEIRFNAERLRMIMEKSDSIIYEWNIIDDTVVFSDNWRTRMGYPHEKNKFLENAHLRDTVHADDLHMCIDLLKKAQKGQLYGEAIIRLKKCTGEYIWVRNCVVTLMDENNVPKCATGVCIDIDSERRESLRLKVKAERDHLTELYNRGATESLIEDILDKSESDSVHAMLLIDVDNFKNINDTYGHQEGDKILRAIGEGLKGLFREGDVTGRIGGDEFLVFIKNVPDESVFYTRVQEVLLMFDGLNRSAKYPVSSSIGVAQFPSHGKTYETLHHKADIAMYSSKKSGKNKFTVYSEDLEV